jgi:hypothetical protein
MALLLDSDTLIGRGVLAVVYERAFKVGEAREIVRDALAVLTKIEAAIIFDVESEAIDGVYMEHDTHGSIESQEITYLDLDEFVALGPRAMFEIGERRSQIAEAASDGGCGDALRRLKELPFDASSWTGIKPELIFDEAVKAKVVSLLHKARDELTDGLLSNREIAQARAFLSAALVLTDTPDPSTDLIWELIQRASAIAGLVGALFGLTQLFRSGT